MSGYFPRALAFSESIISRIERAPYSAPTLISINKDACKPSYAIGEKIAKDVAYFSIRVNELFLKDGRSFLDTYDPMLLVVSDFLHGGVRANVPFVVGADQLKLPATLPSPGSLRFNDILVCGPHPFRGGNLAISIILYKVQRDNHAKDFLKFIESLSSAIGPTANLELLTRVGNAFIEGLDTLLKTKGTIPIMGHRIEFDTTSIAGLSSSVFLLTSDTKINESSLLETPRRTAAVDGLQIATLIGDLSRKVTILTADIAHEEARAEVRDLSDPAYPVLARSLRVRRYNIHAGEPSDAKNQRTRYDAARGGVGDPFD
jgi:hypothetical protein